MDYDHFPSEFVATRRVRVWLAPDYDTSREPFAVLCMQDGQNLFDPPSPMARGAWEVDRPLLALREANAVRPSIVVAVWNTENNRAREYGPQAPVQSLPAEEVKGHGLWATARTMLAERLNVAESVIEAQLAHSIKDSLGRAFNRTEFVEQRRSTMQVWADYLDRLRTGEVVRTLAGRLASS